MGLEWVAGASAFELIGFLVMQPISFEGGEQTWGFGCSVGSGEQTNNRKRKEKEVEFLHTLITTKLVQRLKMRRNVTCGDVSTASALAN